MGTKEGPGQEEKDQKGEGSDRGGTESQVGAGRERLRRRGGGKHSRSSTRRRPPLLRGTIQFKDASNLGNFCLGHIFSGSLLAAVLLMLDNTVVLWLILNPELMCEKLEAFLIC